MELKQGTLNKIADMICGNGPSQETLFRYRSSSYLTEFFHDCYTDYVHDGSSRKGWVADTLRAILAEPEPISKHPPGNVCTRDSHANGPGRCNQ